MNATEVNNGTLTLSARAFLFTEFSATLRSRGEYRERGNAAATPLARAGGARDSQKPKRQCTARAKLALFLATGHTRTMRRTRSSSGRRRGRRGRQKRGMDGERWRRVRRERWRAQCGARSLCSNLGRLQLAFQMGKSGDHGRR